MGGVPARGGQHWITGFVSGKRVRVERERDKQLQGIELSSSYFSLALEYPAVQDGL